MIPKARFGNPAYDKITALYPLPNNPPLPGQQPVNNYLASTRVPDLRQDKTSQWNANMAKNITIREGYNLQLRLNVLNVQNRSQMAAPNVDPTSTNFGRITAQTAATNRWIDVQARLQF